MPDKPITASEDLPLLPLAAGRPVEIALPWGGIDPRLAAAMARFPEGRTEPWHSHTSTCHSVSIEGEFRSHGRDRVSPAAYGPGSLAIQPGGEVHPQTNAGSGARETTGVGA